MAEMIDFFIKKYPNTNPLIPLKAVVYFDDIDPNIDPPKLIKKLPITKIKKRIIDAVIQSKKIF